MPGLLVMVKKWQPGQQPVGQFCLQLETVEESLGLAVAPKKHQRNFVDLKSNLTLKSNKSDNLLKGVLPSN